IKEGYEDAKTLQRRIDAQKKWLKSPVLLKADDHAHYAAVIDIDLTTIKEPILACPNDPDDVRFLSEVAGRPIDEVFIGSCMTNIGHFRAAAQILKGHANLPTRLWVVPPTKMDASELMEEGVYADFGHNGARLEIPGCSLCMGNQARVRDGATVVSTSTRNFPNRMGKDAQVFLSSAELAAVCALLGKIPNVDQYLTYTEKLQPKKDDIYRYLNFDQVARFAETAAH
ncbi:MAG: aconitase family protein, partial [Gammaproteobacteria bacterium]|nr:aconitase family protein [Gammaproteobacteria bacterium]